MFADVVLAVVLHYTRPIRRWASIVDYSRTSCVIVGPCPVYTTVHIVFKLFAIKIYGYIRYVKCIAPFYDIKIMRGTNKWYPGFPHGIK